MYGRVIERIEKFFMISQQKASTEGKYLRNNNNYESQNDVTITVI